MFAFIGLGNPGKEYDHTRHNIGFAVADALIERYALQGPEDKFHGAFYKGKMGAENLAVLKPTTFMNRSGIAASEMLRFYKIPLENTYVCHDELDLAFAKLKIKQGGGHAGHNGLKSLDSHIGNNYHRLRVGIEHPGNREKVTGHVLGKFTEEESITMAQLADRIAIYFPLLIEGKKDRFFEELTQGQN